MGGSVSIAALIVGTTLLGIFALASMSLTDSAKTASEAMEDVTTKPELRLLNASESNGTIHLNLTNLGNNEILYENTWFSIDGNEPIRISAYHNLTNILFSGEVHHLQITGLGISNPSRIFVSTMGSQSGVAFT